MSLLHHPEVQSHGGWVPALKGRRAGGDQNIAVPVVQVLIQLVGDLGGSERECLACPGHEVSFDVVKRHGARSEGHQRHHDDEELQPGVGRTRMRFRSSHGSPLVSQRVNSNEEFLSSQGNLKNTVGPLG